VVSWLISRKWIYIPELTPANQTRSYGKTVTALALIDEEFTKFNSEEIVNAFTGALGLIRTAATLIVTPDHLIPQWREEIRKFLPGVYNGKREVLMISNYTTLQKLSVQDLLNAKIVLASWSVLNQASYLNQLALLTALPAPKVQDVGRESKSWLDYALDELPSHVKLLMESTSIREFAGTMKNKLDIRMNDAEFQAQVPAKRLRGRAYQKAKSKKLTSRDIDLSNERPKGEITSLATNDLCSFKSLSRPLFHLFRWNRLIVDEFALITNKSSLLLSSLTRLEAEKRWVLSGTPRLEDFHDIKTIAKLIGVDLGIDSFSPGAISNDKAKSLLAELSSAEKFQSFQEMRSVHWHIQRNVHAHNFLDMFVRQNNAKVGHIHTISLLRPISLGASHRAIYEELNLYLNSVNMRERDCSKSTSDREQRVSRSILNCNTVEKALLRCCAVFAADGSTNEFFDLIALRQGQLESLQLELFTELQIAEYLKKKNGDSDGKYKRWQLEPAGDQDTTKILRNLTANARKSVDKACPNMKDKLKEKVLDLRRLSRELTSRVRALRYVQAIHQLQQYAPNSTCDETGKFCSVDDCSSPNSDPGDVRILSLCGHIVCNNCLDRKEVRHSCVVKGCAAEMDEYHIKSAADFGQKERMVDGKSFGAKLDTIAGLLQSIDEDDQAILFVQDNDLIGEAKACFQSRNIVSVPLFAEASGDQAKDAIEKFKSSATQKVLILCLDSEHATGL
jgi:hypothetical protein